MHALGLFVSEICVIIHYMNEREIQLSGSLKIKTNCTSQWYIVDDFPLTSNTKHVPNLPVYVLQLLLNSFLLSLIKESKFRELRCNSGLCLRSRRS